MEPTRHVIHTRIGQGRRVAIPAELCRRYGLEPGTPVVLESADGGVVVRPLAAVVREVRDYFRAAIPGDVRLSDELVRDREAEAAREGRG